MLKRFLKFFSYPKPEPKIPPKMQAEMDKMLAALKDHTIHRELSQEILHATPDEELDQLIIDNLFTIIGADDREELEIVQDFTPGQQAIYTTWFVEEEVLNGGFNQFYFNSSKQYADLAVQGFKIIGAYKFAELMDQANSLFCHIQPDLSKYNDGTLESFSASYDQNPLNDLDDLFYKLSKEENLHALRISYIRQHPQDFIPA